MPVTVNAFFKKGASAAPKGKAAKAAPKVSKVRCQQPSTAACAPSLAPQHGATCNWPPWAGRRPRWWPPAPGALPREPAPAQPPGTPRTGCAGRGEREPTISASHRVLAGSNGRPNRGPSSEFGQLRSSAQARRGAAWVRPAPWSLPECRRCRPGGGGCPGGSPGWRQRRARSRVAATRRTCRAQPTCAPPPSPQASSGTRKGWFGGEESSNLSKWYGPDRALFLPGGLLDRNDLPDYLDGTLPGDYGCVFAPATAMPRPDLSSLAPAPACCQLWGRDPPAPPLPILSRADLVIW